MDEEDEKEIKADPLDLIANKSVVKETLQN
jgi:hypothetical protein